MSWWNTDNPSHCQCPRSRYSPRNMRPTHPDCPKHGENTEVEK